MAYTTINKSTDYFNTKLYTANGGTLSVTGVGFQPDLVWGKQRTNAENHELYDAVRGATKRIQSNLTNAETTSASYLTSFDSDGFSLGSGTRLNNTNGATCVSWNWKAGTSFTNDASSTGIGTIDSVGSVNATAGFSVVKYTGTGSNGTIKHGLSSPPTTILFKSLGANDWVTYHAPLGNVYTLRLNENGAKVSSATSFNSTSPTSTVFSIGTDSKTNSNGTAHVAYCFSDIQGFSKTGLYTGNGNVDGTFVYTGFRVDWLLRKRTDQGSASTWLIHDSKRGINTNAVRLRAEITDAESSGNEVDLLSNGFKIRENGGYGNASGSPYIYVAFGQSIVASNNTPATAR